MICLLYVQTKTAQNIDTVTKMLAKYGTALHFEAQKAYNSLFMPQLLGIKCRYTNKRHRSVYVMHGGSRNISPSMKVELL